MDLFNKTEKERLHRCLSLALKDRGITFSEMRKSDDHKVAIAARIQGEAQLTPAEFDKLIERVAEDLAWQETGDLSVRAVKNASNIFVYNRVTPGPDPIRKK